MPTIYAPNGMAHFMPSLSAARAYVTKKGYTYEPKHKPTNAPVKSTSDSQGQVQTFSIKINTATANDLIKIDGVGVAKAKKIVDAQPNIKSIDNLTDVIDDVDWYEPKVEGKIIELDFS